jgi:hypothetical protein
MITLWRCALVLFVLIISFLSLAIVREQIGPAHAAGSPDLTVAAELEAETLHGGTTEVSIGVENNSGIDGFNLSGQAILPPGISYVSGDVTAGADP